MTKRLPLRYTWLERRAADFRLKRQKIFFVVGKAGVLQKRLRTVKRMTDFSCYLLDMDGTLYLGGKLIEGAAEAVEKMRARGRVLFLTNNTSTSRAAYALRLSALGIPAAPADIYTAGNATADYIRENHRDARVYLLGTDALKTEFIESGVQLAENAPSLVVVGFDTTLTYEKLSKTCAFIRDGVPFIATHPDFNCPVLNGYIPDVGSFLALIEASTGRRPIAVCGKPNRAIADGVSRLCGARGKDVAMFGDRLYTDVRFAVENGFYSVLVLSGEATKEDLENSGMQVDRVVESVAHFFD